MAKAYLDCSIAKCPKCNWIYAEASWYAAELGCDVQCGKCGNSFNFKKELIDRILLKFKIKEGKVKATEIEKSFASEKKFKERKQNRLCS